MLCSFIYKFFESWKGRRNGNVKREDFGGILREPAVKDSTVEVEKDRAYWKETRRQRGLEAEDARGSRDDESRS